MSSWGILGNPTKTEIEAYMNMPHGAFKMHVDMLKKKSKGKPLRVMNVKITRNFEHKQETNVKVNAFTETEAITKAKVIDKSSFEWSELKISKIPTYSYSVS